jgi:hypothetical protein
VLPGYRNDIGYPLKEDDLHSNAMPENTMEIRMRRLHEGEEESIRSLRKAEHDQEYTNVKHI